MNAIYIAHPYGGDRANAERATRWHRWFLREFPTNNYLCQWLQDCLYEDDGDEEQRKHALNRDCDTVNRCDAIALVGGDLTRGMRQELQVAKKSKGRILAFDLTAIGPEPPELGSYGWTTNRRLALIHVQLSGKGWGVDA